ncbi:hypothetical protein [Vulcanisaeta distributa]|uniref:Uncharacterized protein n=1 Tax=Vulcanisaeta distributa (strain DSM 14429 / JCM 11212 / NBRC 100878 / IC-017) TaxID=572478 RepID=E1QP79_VULDI|nr:hypothetical protein [Vulcanisaeta distributa]ADN50250.1 hypothetical protein Vdis_0859 [Vulcanisaeta distributa DSM 14429]
MTGSKTNWTKLIIPVVTLIVVIGVVAGLGHPALAQVTYGPYGPVSVPVPPKTYSWTLYWNLTDARLTSTYTTTNPVYQYLIDYMVPWYFTAGKSFSIYIANASDVYYWTSSGWQLGSPIEMTATATANSTGGVTWTVSTTLTGGIQPNQVYANWTIVIVLNGYGGANWLVFNVTSIFMDLADLMGNLTTVSTGSYIPVSPSIAQSLVPYEYTEATYYGVTTQDYPAPIPGTTSTSQYAIEYPLFRPVNGSETTPSDLYVVLPDLYFFFLYVGAATDTTSIYPLPPSPQLEASVTLGTGVTVFGPTTYNSTVSAASQSIYSAAYTGFGPIYYVTNEFGGLNSADHNYPSITAQPITITVSYVYPSGQSVTLFNYTTATANNETTPESFNVAVAYNWTVGSIALTAIINGTTDHEDPALLVGIPVVEFYLGNVTDLKGNLIIGNATYIPNPILAEKLYVKWLLSTTPTATVVSENYLRYYETTPALLPVGYFSGTGPGAPTLTTTGFPTPELYIFYENQPVFTATLSVSGVTSVTINNITVALMPVFINITQFAAGTNATQQLPLSPNQVPYITAYYMFSSQSPIIQQSPPSGAESGMLYYEEQVWTNETTYGTYYPATIAQFPPFEESSIAGILVTPEVNWLPAPPLTASITARSSNVGLTASNYTTGAQYYYYSFWLTYNGMTVGYGVYEVGYNVTGSPGIFNEQYKFTTPEVPIFQPVYGSNATLAQFYGSAGELAVTTPTGVNPSAGTIVFANVTVERAFIAATYTVYNVQFLNLCNETITSGTVYVSEMTPSGASITLTPVTLSSSAYIMKITSPIGLKISSVSGVPYIVAMSPTFNFTLNYYGYVMPSVSYTTRQPEYNYVLTPGIINVVYFPLIDINIQVLSQTTPQYPLWGFAVSVYNYNGTFEMWHAITNSSGFVYVMNVPLNASYIQPQGKAYVMLKVRTISPATDSAYPYAQVSYEYGQTYSQYASDLNIPSGYYAYTLGTRGPFDEDLVIYYEPLSVPVTATCGQVFNVTVPVETLRVYVTDLKGNVLSSQPVYPCATPSYCPSFYYNVTLVIADQYSPYDLASQWATTTPAFTFYYNLTDFRVVGQTWMQPIYESLEEKFEALMSAAQSEYQSGLISLQQYAMWYTGNYSYYILAATLANYSTASPYAVFSFPSIVPHEGTIFVRLFMPGQVFPMKVYYLGQEVFNQLVPVPQPNEIAVVKPNGQVQYVTNYTVYEGGQAVSVPPGSVVIETSVYPVTFNITSKSGLYPVGNTYLGLTFTDVLYREYVMPGTSLGTSVAQQYISNILYPFSAAIEPNSLGYSSGILTPNDIYVIMNNGTYAIVETYGTTTVDYNPRAVAGYEPVNNVYSMAGYVLPNLMGFFVNSSSPTISLTPLYMTSIYPNVFSTTPSTVVFNLTMGIPTYSTVLGTTATAYPNDTFLYAPSASYSEYRLLINESLLAPTQVLLNGTSVQAMQLSGISPTTYAVEVSQQYYSVLNFTYSITPNIASYRLWEAYINATGMTSITNATIGIYAANATGWYFVYRVNEISTFQEAMTRTIPLYLTLNVSAIESKVENVQYVAVVLYIYGSGSLYILPPAAATDHVHVQYPVLSTGFGGTIGYNTENLYTNSTGTGTMSITFSYPVPNNEWYPYFGSPLTVVIPVPSSGEAVFDIPWWAPTTGAYGTRIARFWVMGTTSTQNIGYGSITTVYTPSQYTPTAPSPLPELAISSYVLLNYITPEQGASTVYTGEIPPGTVSSSGSLYMTAIGAGTGGTSAPMLMYDTLFPENLWNVTLSTMPANGVYNIRTTALESVDIYNNASFPIFVTGFTYSSAGSNYPLSAPTTEVVPGTLAEIPAKYIYGSSYEFTSTWCDLGNYTPYIPDLSATFYYTPPNATFYLANGTALPFTVYPNGTVVIGTHTYSISQLEAPLQSPSINFTTLYAGSELDSSNTTVTIPQFGESARSSVYYESYYNYTSSIVGAQAILYDHEAYPVNGAWDIAGYVGVPSAPELLPSASNDTEAKMVFTYPTIPLAVIEDWDGRPLPNQMVVEYGVGTKPVLCAGTAPIAIDFSGTNGQLLQPLPVGNRTVVYWYDSCLLYTITGGAYPYINIYDTNIATDVSTLGNAFTATSVETHVVPATIYLKSATGTGIPGALVVVFDQPTMGNELLAFNVTGTDGSITPVDYRIYPPATSQLPPTNYYVVAYYAANGTPLTWQEIQQAISSHSTLYLVPVFENTFSIQRTVTATEAIESFTLSNILTTANIVVVLSSFGPAPGVTLSYSVSEPECPVTITAISPASTIVGYTYSVTPLMPSPSVCTPTTAVTGTGTTNAQGQITTATFVTPVAPFAAEVTITVQSWKGIPLGYTYTYYVTSSNATTPIQVSVPAVELTVTPVSASGAPLTTQATVNVTCSGVPIASGVGQQTVVVPIPSSGSITCTITGYSYGKSASTTVTLTSSQAGQTITKTLTIPVSGYYIPGVGFVPVSTFILLAVVIIIIIILIVILLIEYSNWRRRRLAGLLGPPK